MVDRLHATYAGKVEPLPYDGRRDPETGIANAGSIRSYAIELASKVVPLIEQGSFPVVLGGDCSILLGTTLALRRLGTYGLFFLDGHGDFYLPDSEPRGEVASMELALLSGRGPPILADIDGRGPLVRDKDIVAFGFRDADQAALEGGQSFGDTGIKAYSLERARSEGIGPAAMNAVGELLREGVTGFWIHLDADVLSDEDMPAVDYRQPGGLNYQELSDILRILLSTGRAVGLTVTIYNPSLDREGVYAQRLVDSIAEGLCVTNEHGPI